MFLSMNKKTLPEAQRTQGIESITWVNLSTIIVWNWFQWNFLQIWPPDGATCNGCQFCHWWTTCTLIPIWPPDGANCISCKFAHQMALLSLVPYLTTRWHHLHWLQTCPPDSTTWISYKFGHHMSPLVLVPNLTTRLLLQIWPPDRTTCITNKFAHQTKSHTLPDCLGLPYWHYQLVLTWYLHQPESH